MDSQLRQSVFVIPAIVQIAHRCELFAAAGIEVSTDLVASSVAQRDDLIAGRCDVAITAIDNLFAWNAAGADIALVAQIETSTRLVLALRPGLDGLVGSADDGPIRLGVDAPDNGFAVVLRAFMAHRGLTADQYTLVEVGGVLERLDALGRGDVDATLLSPPLDVLAVSRGMSLTGPSLDEVAPGYPGLGIVARRNTLVQKRTEIIAYLGALGRALTLADEADDTTVAEWLSQDRFDDRVVTTLRETMPTSLAPSPRGLQVLAEVRDRLGMAVAGAPRPEELVDHDVVTEAVAAMHA